MTKVNTKRLVESAILIAVGFILSFIKVKIMPNASVSLVSMLPIIILAYKYGPSWGMLCGLVHGILQMIEGGISTPPTETFWSYFFVVTLEYLFAFSIIGIGGIARKISKKPYISLSICTVVGIFARFICSFLAGVFIWGVYAPEGQNPVIYSLTINSVKFGIEIIATVIIGSIIISLPAIQKYINPLSKEKQA